MQEIFSEMNHFVATAHKVEPWEQSASAVCTWAGLVGGEQSERPPPSSGFKALLSSLELGDFNLSKLFTSMPPRLLLVCHEGADR